MAISPEALLGVTGIDRILSDEMGKITVSDKSKAEMMPREIRRALQRFVTEEGARQPIRKMGKFDYDKALKQITEAIDADQTTQQPTVKPAILERIANSFRPEDHDLAAGYLSNVQRVIPYMQTILPINVVTKASGKINYDPSDSEVSHFRRAYDIANDPMVVCQDMESGIVVADQLLHLQACYPKIYDFLKTQLETAITEEMGKRKKPWKLPYRQELIAQMIFGADTISQALAADLQRSFAAQDQSQNQQQGGGGGGAPPRTVSKTASMFQSQTQATADGDLRK